MKTRIPIALIICSLLFGGCLTQEERSTFAEEGIQVGTPRLEANGDVFVPVEFTTAIIHSGMWLHSVKTVKKENEITLRAYFTVPPFLKESIYPGGITIKDPKYEEYTLSFKDPDGKLHKITKIKMPAKKGKAGD